MKKWIAPAMEKMDIQATEYSPNSGSRVDGAYTTKDGKYERYTYGPSGGNAGTPSLAGNDPSAIPAADFVHVD